MNFDDLPPLRDVIAAHSLSAQKSLGQNFLLDSNITDKIASYADIDSSHNVFEIGPGPGGLTRSLLKSSAKLVTALEFDERAVKALEDLCLRATGRLRIVHMDALKADLTSLSEAPRGIVANLPYNIATPLLFKWLEQIYDNPENFDFMVLMFQREVADRITATFKAQKAYGRLSIMAQWLCDVNRAYDLPASAFTPPPKVSSSIVVFKPKTDLGCRPKFKTMEALIAKAFGQRRKMIRASLKSYVHHIENLGLDPTLRAENLGISDYAALAQLIDKAAGV